MGLHDCFTATSFALDILKPTAGMTQSNPNLVNIQDVKSRSKSTMKINRFIAVAAIALIAIGATGFMSTRAHAQVTNPPAPQAQVTHVPNHEQAVGADTDQVQELVGDQNGPDTVAESGKKSSEAAGIDGQDAAPAGTPSISADAAVKAAQTHLNSTAAGKATLDDENGKLVYSVDLNGSDVKVDAITGSVLSVDQAGEGQVDSGN